MSAPTPAASPPLPLRHCYWVVPGLLLAGEHPGGSTRDKTKDRLKKLLAAGIECFVDLTKPTELLRYDTHLPFYVEYARKAIKDHGLPGSREQMVEILEHVGNAMRAGRPVYVHCRAGIGRTGTVIGCLLVERGLAGEAAIAELNRLWQQSRRSKSWPFIPETEAQVNYIREWQPGLNAGGFELNSLASAVAGVGPMTAGGSLIGAGRRGAAGMGADAGGGAGARPGPLTVADVQARAASQATGAGQARAAMNNLAAGKGRKRKNSGADYVSGAGLTAAAAQARAAVERGEILPPSPGRAGDHASAGGHHGFLAAAPMRGDADGWQGGPAPGLGADGRHSAASPVRDAEARHGAATPARDANGRHGGVPPAHGDAGARSVGATEARDAHTASPREADAGVIAPHIADASGGPRNGRAEPPQAQRTVPPSAEEAAIARVRASLASAVEPIRTDALRIEPISIVPSQVESLMIEPMSARSSPRGSAAPATSGEAFHAGSPPATSASVTPAAGRPASVSEADALSAPGLQPGGLAPAGLQPGAPSAEAEPLVESDPLLDPATLEVARQLRERFVGALFGLAVGDAVAAATQFRRPGTFTPVGDMIGGGPFDLPRGAWSDDTAMALCLAESLLECDGFDPRDQVQRYARWQQDGYLSATGQCVGITASTARSLAIAKWRRVVFPGSHDPEQLDPEPLSRVVSIALFYFASLETTLQQAADSSRTTCQAPAVVDACRRLGRALNAALSGQPKDRILAEGAPSTAAGAVPITAAAAQTNNTAASALAAAFWAFGSTDNFRDAVLRASNVGGNSDVVASVCGQLAGAHYGLSAIPPSWRNGLMHKDLIEAYADRMLAHGLVSLSA